MRGLALVGLVGLTLVAPRTAAACDWGPGPAGWIKYPWWSADRFPVNGLFTSSLEWRTPGGAPLRLVPDEELSARWGQSVRRPESALVPGTIYEPTEGCPSSPCTYQLVIGTADTQPPSAPILSVRTLLVRDPEGAGALSCPDIDSLELTVEATDDTTPGEHLAIAAYIAPDLQALAARTDFDLIFGFDPGPADEIPTTATIALGEAVGRKRDGGWFRAAGPFCFAVAVVDWAGNVGPHSEPVCLDTTDPNDPTVTWVESTGCGCQSGGREAPWWLAAVLLVSRARRSRDRSRARRCDEAGGDRRAAGSP